MQTRSRRDYASQSLHTILFVGRSPDRYAPIWRQLAMQNVTLLFAETRNQAKRRARRVPIHTVVVDDSALSGPGLQTCRMMRTLTPAAAIVLISEDEPGPSWFYDYHVQTPVDRDRLVTGLQRAPACATGRYLEAGPFALDWATGRLTGPTGDCKLAPKQADLMAFFIERAGQPQSRATIMQEVWHTSFLGDLRTLEVHICLLRRLVEPDPHLPNYLVTLRGTGYVFYPDGRPSEHENPEFGV